MEKIWDAISTFLVARWQKFLLVILKRVALHCPIHFATQDSQRIFRRGWFEIDLALKRVRQTSLNSSCKKRLPLHCFLIKYNAPVLLIPFLWNLSFESVVLSLPDPATVRCPWDIPYINHNLSGLTQLLFAGPNGRLCSVTDTPCPSAPKNPVAPGSP